MMLNLILLAAVVLGGSAGDVSVARGMRKIGEVSSFRLPALLAAALRAVRSRFIWLGVFCKAVAFFSLLPLLTRADLSWIVPATAAAYVVETLAARYLLQETVSRMRWAGTLCVGVGVALISL